MITAAWIILAAMLGCLAGRVRGHFVMVEALRRSVREEVVNPIPWSLSDDDGPPTDDYEGELDDPELMAGLREGMAYTGRSNAPSAR